jgi:Domain of unknown function (DUF4410)
MTIVRNFNIALLCTIASVCQIASAQNDVGNFYMGKVKVEVVKTYNSPAVLPKPDTVQIQDFALPVGVVTLDDSAAGRLHTRIFLRRDPADASVPAALAQQVQTSFSKALISDLQKSNVQAQRVVGNGSLASGSFLMVSGEITAIDEGNKVKRVMVGLGRGESDVQTHVTISSVTNGQATVVLELNLHSASGKKLGALETAGGGSIALSAAEGDVGDRHSTVQADASRMAKGVAKQIQELMLNQKWITAPVTVADASH